MNKKHFSVLLILLLYGIMGYARSDEVINLQHIGNVGEVVVKAGVEYEIEASGTVTLQGGFKVEKGATFAVYPSSF